MLLCVEFALKSQIRQNDENISFGYRSDRIFRFGSVSGHNIIHVVSNNTETAPAISECSDEVNLVLSGTFEV